MKNNFKRNNYTWTHEFGCYLCKHFSHPDKYPIKDKKISCKLHNLDLSFMLNEDGFLTYIELFCIDIEPTTEYEFHTKEFNRIKPKLKPKHFYILHDQEIEEKRWNSVE